MYQTLFYIKPDIYGIPLFGFGLALAIWAVVAVVILVSSVRRNGWNSDTQSYILILGLMGGAIYFVVPHLLDHNGQGLPIRGFGVMMLLGVVGGVGLSIYRANQMGVDSEVIFSLSFWMFIFGILGARLFFVIEYRHLFIKDTIEESIKAILNVPEGGIVLYGAFFGGIGAALVFFVKRKLPTLALADIIVPGMVVGACLGRVGCFLNGCCFGGLCDPATDLPKVEFPYHSPPYQDQLAKGWLHGLKLEEDQGHVLIKEVTKESAAASAGLVRGDEIVAVNGHPIAAISQMQQLFIESAAQPDKPLVTQLADRTVHKLAFVPPPRALPVHPAQLYDAVNLALMALVLWLYFPLRRHDGELLAVGMIFYSITRFVMEIIRVDEPSQLDTGLSISQLLSFGVFLTGVVLLTYVELRNRPFALPWHGSAATA
jgi:phosphatidylglycerol:prolipoprotein diacylglycerol transferase